MNTKFKIKNWLDEFKNSTVSRNIVMKTELFID